MVGKLKASVWTGLGWEVEFVIQEVEVLPAQWGGQSTPNHEKDQMVGCSGEEGTLTAVGNLAPNSFHFFNHLNRQSKSSLHQHQGLTSDQQMTLPSAPQQGVCENILLQQYPVLSPSKKSCSKYVWTSRIFKVYSLPWFLLMFKASWVRWKAFEKAGTRNTNLKRSFLVGAKPRPFQRRENTQPRWFAFLPQAAFPAGAGQHHTEVFRHEPSPRNFKFCQKQERLEISWDWLFLGGSIPDS